MNEAKQTLVDFLAMPHDAASVLEKFATLPGAVYYDADKENGAFVYIPATRRKNPVLLMAHADVDIDLGIEPELLEENGIIYNGAKDLLGADDRAGCAILWLLRNLGHGMLIGAGEECGELAMRNLVEHYPELAEEINTKYQFAVEMDKSGDGIYACYDVGSPEFEEYIQKATSFTRAPRQTCTDICVLCRKMCGVNLSVGYYHEHRYNEQLVYSQWLHTLNTAAGWLSQEELPRFTIS